MSTETKRPDGKPHFVTLLSKAAQAKLYPIDKCLLLAIVNNSKWENGRQILKCRWPELYNAAWLDRKPAKVALERLIAAGLVAPPRGDEYVLQVPRLMAVGKKAAGTPYPEKYAEKKRRRGKDLEAGKKIRKRVLTELVAECEHPECPMKAKLRELNEEDTRASSTSKPEQRQVHNDREEILRDWRQYAKPILPDDED